MYHIIYYLNVRVYHHSHDFLYNNCTRTYELHAMLIMTSHDAAYAKLLLIEVFSMLAHMLITQSILLVCRWHSYISVIYQYAMNNAQNMLILLTL